MTVAVRTGSEDGADDARQRAEVPTEFAGLRLDAACARLFDGWSRARIQLWIEQGRLRVNGAVVDRGRQPVTAGDVLELDAQVETEMPLRPQAIALDVMHEDKSIAVIN